MPDEKTVEIKLKKTCQGCPFAGMPRSGPPNDYVCYGLYGDTSPFVKVFGEWLARHLKCPIEQMAVKPLTALEQSEENIAKGIDCEICKEEIDGKESDEMRTCESCEIMEARGIRL